MSDLSIEECERLVRQVVPDAHLFISDSGFTKGFWSICTGHKSRYGEIRIPGVGWHETAEQAWRMAVVVTER
jgi:hypothetical protein